MCECETRFLERKEASNPPSVMKMSETRCSVLDSMTGGGEKKGDDHKESQSLRVLIFFVSFVTFVVQTVFVLLGRYVPLMLNSCRYSIFHLSYSSIAIFASTNFIGSLLSGVSIFLLVGTNSRLAMICCPSGLSSKS